MAQRDPIPDNDHLIRYVPWGKLRRKVLESDQEVVIGIEYTAFELRPDEEYLSATWVEFFPGHAGDQRIAAVKTIRNTRKCGGKSGFAIGQVREIKEACIQHGHQVRIVEEPESGNQAHVAIRRYPRDEIELFGILAAVAWSELLMNSDVPA